MPVGVDGYDDGRVIVILVMGLAVHGCDGGFRCS